MLPDDATSENWKQNHWFMLAIPLCIKVIVFLHLEMWHTCVNSIVYTINAHIYSDDMYRINVEIFSCTFTPWTG